MYNLYGFYIAKNLRFYNYFIAYEAFTKSARLLIDTEMDFSFISNWRDFKCNIKVIPAATSIPQRALNMNGSIAK